MPRKKITGRSRPITPQSKFLLQLEKVNAKLNSLERSKNLYSYSSKTLINTIKRDNNIKYLSKKKVKLNVNIEKLNSAQLRYYSKQFDKFLKSKTSTQLGIMEVRKKSEASLKETLGQLVDKDITTQDLDDFYYLMGDRDVQTITEFIDPSELYVLIDIAKEKNYSKNDFVSLLNKYMTSNNEETRLAANRIYEKYVS